PPAVRGDRVAEPAVVPGEAPTALPVPCDAVARGPRTTPRGEEPMAEADALAGYPVVVEQAVVWGGMDAYRHVNHVVSFRSFENAGVEYFRGLGWEEIEAASGVGPILAATRARFRRPLTYPDTIRIGARLGSLGEDRFTLDHRIVSRALGAVCAEGEGT